MGTGEVGVSSGCSECYAVNGEYASKNCKAACLLGWCKQGCLDCSTAAAPKAALDSCTGFTSGSATPCLESESTGACSADEQAALSDSATVGKAGSDCGLGAYNVLTGNFNHDKFNECFTGKLSVSSGCSECYATNGEYAAKNCRSALTAALLLHQRLLWTAALASPLALQLRAWSLNPLVHAVLMSKLRSPILQLLARPVPTVAWVHTTCSQVIST